MEEILEVFNKVINKSGGTITLTYCHHNFSGTCVYEQVTTKGLKKPIVQNFLVLTSTDMGDVIEYMHKKSPLSSEDLSSINKLIRDHSLSVVDNYLSDLH
jgi:tRNA A-37 threonylcarbamoyl transferase component Bud32